MHIPPTYQPLQQTKYLRSAFISTFNGFRAKICLSEFHMCSAHCAPIMWNKNIFEAWARTMLKKIWHWWVKRWLLKTFTLWCLQTAADIFDIESWYLGGTSWSYATGHKQRNPLDWGQSTGVKLTLSLSTRHRIHQLGEVFALTPSKYF